LPHAPTNSSTATQKATGWPSRKGCKRPLPGVELVATDVMSVKFIDPLYWNTRNIP